jgi:transposase-like protein
MNVVKNFPKTSSFKWTPERSQAAILLAEGYTYQEVADEIGKTKRTITAWMGEIEFSAEVDRLSLMCGIASRAERLRLIKRVIRQQAGDKVTTDKDVLDWLKFAQSETDGARLNLAALASALGADETSVADGGLDRTRKAKTT